MSPQVHKFVDSLKLSHEFEDAPWWESVYRAAFPGFAGMYSARNDGWWQRAGIDRVVQLKNSRQVLIDEKVRLKAWPDFLLERWSDRERRVPGWIQKDQACDYIAYALAPTGVCYMLPFQQLRNAWLCHGREWIALAEDGDRKDFHVVPAENPHYTTESIAVPVEVVLAALLGAMRIEFEPTSK